MVLVLAPSVASSSPRLDQIAVGLVAVTAAYQLYKAVNPTNKNKQTQPSHDGVREAHTLAQHSWVVGDLVEVVQNADRFFEWTYDVCVRLNGEPWKRQIPMQPVTVVLSTPKLVEDVLSTQKDAFDKGESVKDIFAEVMGYRPMVWVENDEWIHLRKSTTRFFTVRMFRERATNVINHHLYDNVFGVIDAAIARRDSVNLTQLIQEFTLESICKLALGLELNHIGNPAGHPFQHALDGMMPHVLRRIQSPHWLWKTQRLLRVGPEVEFHQHGEVIKQTVSEMVSKSLNQAAAQAPTTAKQPMTTILELLIESMERGDVPHSAEVLRDNAIGFVIGGRDTTATALAWLLYELSHHPEVEAKIRDELYAVVPHVMEGKARMTMDEAQQLTYLEAVIKETLRMYPPAPMIQREAKKDIVLADGTLIHKGYQVAIAIEAMGRMASIWGPDATTFRPERWIDAATGKLRVVSAYKYVAFGAGHRVCIGMNFSYLEMKLFVTGLLSRYRLHIEPNDGTKAISANLAMQHPLIAHPVAI